MELKSCTYATVTTLGDFGPWISKVVLDLPCTVRANDIDARTFHIYVERHERTGEILMRKERGADHAAPSVGYVDVLAAYPCDECGQISLQTGFALRAPSFLFFGPSTSVAQTAMFCDLRRIGCLAVGQ